MEIRHLRYFVAMAETGSLMKASERLHVAQPALSVHLANLEAELGTTLVTRSNRGVELTPDGAFLYERAVNLLKYHQDSLVALKDRSARPSGQVSVGLTSAMPALLAPELYRAASKALPDVTLYIVDASTSALYEWLQEGRIDMVTCFNLLETSELDSVPLYQEAYYLVGQPSPEDDGSDEIEFDDILDLPLAMPSASTTLRKAMDDAAERRGLRVTPRIETESAQALKALALAGDCYAVLPRACVHDEMMRGTLYGRKLVNPNLRGMMTLVNLASRPLGPAQLAVRELIKTITRQFADDMDTSPTPSSVMRTTPTSLFPNANVRKRAGLKAA
ncbi:LysR substrate-binding domain-containing protein [soil metagenome]